MQLHARILHGVFAVFGFATGEEADAVFHGPGGVALAEQVGVSRGADGGFAACADHGVRRRVAGDAPGALAIRSGLSSVGMWCSPLLRGAFQAADGFA